jgi:hypothetical protein
MCGFLDRPELDVDTLAWFVFKLAECKSLLMQSECASLALWVCLNQNQKTVRALLSV